MAGTFLLTFDCEGKWGVVDRLGPRYECYTTPCLEAAYHGVLALLQRYRVGATFAFTAAFSMTGAEFGRMRGQIDGSAAGASPWIRRALGGIERDGGNGWFAPSCFRAVEDASIHEVASHGFSHMPWGAAWATREVVDAELALNRQVPGFSSDAVETFIYPRNQVAHTELLPPHGFHIFRAARRSFGRPANLMRELNLFASSEQLGPVDHLPVAVPAGYFLNWRLGLRRCIPVAWTVGRWEHILRHAALTGGVVHAWTHPENFIDGHSMFRLLEKILHFAANEREAGRLRIETCSELVRLSPSSQRLLRPVPEPRAIIGA
jgi:peptidoglycan/xylan/chitin deacetylase (PgdA/CDA1 family)